MVRRFAIASLLVIAACGGGDKVTGPDPLLTDTPFDLAPLGQGAVTDRFTAELWAVGDNTAYTTTWGTRTVNGVQARGNAVKIWNVASSSPVLVDSLIVPGATTLGDVQSTSDNRYLIVATETAGSIVIYDIVNPRSPVLITRFEHPDIANGVHTAEVQTINGNRYAFLSIDPRGSDKARLVIVDITSPSSPSVKFSQIMGAPFVHDVFVRDGIMMTALWNEGLAIWDIGGAARGGTISNPVRISTLQTAGGQAHNIFWYRDDRAHDRRFVFVGEEGPGSVPSTSEGDVHVIDVSNLSAPREVAFYNVPGAGVHNFSADESRGILYAAYYNGGVRALSIRGDLGKCSAEQKSADGRCDLRKMNRELAKGPVGVSPVYVWGVYFDASANRLYASDMLNGLWRVSTVPEF
jgi:hypothetical protein